MGDKLAKFVEFLGNKYKVIIEGYLIVFEKAAQKKHSLLKAILLKELLISLVYQLWAQSKPKRTVKTSNIRVVIILPFIIFNLSQFFIMMVWKNLQRKGKTSLIIKYEPILRAFLIQNHKFVHIVNWEEILSLIVWLVKLFPCISQLLF